MPRLCTWGQANDAAARLRELLTESDQHRELDIIASYICAPDNSNKPKPLMEHYYDAGGLPTIDVIRAKLTPEQYKGFCLGNVIKYALRSNYKNAAQSDAKKMAQYAGWLVDATSPQ